MRGTEDTRGARTAHRVEERLRQGRLSSGWATNWVGPTETVAQGMRVRPAVTRRAYIYKFNF
jgi:hypothetical protein